MSSATPPEGATALRCNCKPWKQSWKAESPGRCTACGNPFGDGLDKAREVCLKTETCLLLPGHEGECNEDGLQMSASEKLRALDEAMTESYNRTLAKAEPPYFSSREISILRNALPQIVAVVEAAESVEHVENVGTGEEWLDGVKRLRVALAALEEQLGGVT